ncbi:Kelch domain protein [Sandaracinus amylolyticus]|uniref:Kelch domain protein n=1 Tax=Sandaracinus amylolyticus TaxID=927083 RepID=A0A0F6YJ83_9BACT|nr:Kelch domain protein [Sandaracinus amylolyticus]
MLSLSGLVGGCGGGEHADLRIELAPTPEPGSTDGDRECEPGSDAALPAEVDCVTVTACRREGASCLPVEVLRPSDSRDARTTELRFPREGTGGDLAFDLALEEGADHEIELRAYADGVPYARGRAEGVRAGQDTIRVRLEPYGVWSCAPPRDDGSAPVARALHAAVAVPNGDVLLVGGVTGESVQALSVEGGALLQRTIEVYDASEARFVQIDVTDHDGSEGFGAVFHRALFLDTLADGRYRVRVIGGFTARDQPGARFDAIQGLTNYSSPMLPGARAEHRDSVDLLYDPRTRAIEVQLVDPGVVRRAGMNGVSEPDASGLVVVALGLLDGGGTALRPSPMISGQWYSLARQVSPVTAMPMLAPRFGHTASRLSDASVLVWGGDVTQATVEDVAANAGEVLGSGARAIASTPDLPPPTAFHTATAIRGGVLIAGGMEIAPVAGMSGGVSTTASTRPLTVISADGDGMLRGVPVSYDATAWPTPSIHAATALPGGSVIVSGGALRTMPAGAPSPSHLWATDAVLLVSRDEADAYVAQTLARMIGARWGHAITPLSGGRVLVTGGFVRDGGTLRAISSGETFIVEPAPPPISSCEGQTSGDAGTQDGGVAGDASIAPDGAISDDASVPSDDAAITPADDAGA